MKTNYCKKTFNETRFNKKDIFTGPKTDKEYCIKFI
jgi:hypothetical protein